MATVQTRPFSRDYSGLVTQSVVALCLATLCVTWHEVKKRKRRGPHREERLGSVESWQFGYLYQGRSWAKNPSPPHPRGWPLSWVPEVIRFPEERLNDLRGVDATLYCRFLRGCFWFTLLHTFTTTPILLPIHIRFSDNEFNSKSMNRALIASLFTSPTGLRLLWIHLVLVAWVSGTWILTLLWICKGCFQFRHQRIEKIAAAASAERQKDSPYVAHPHPQHPFHDTPPLEQEKSSRGLRLRTVMVSNIPGRLRSEQELKEYFEYHMARNVPKPVIGITSTAHPGFFNTTFSYLFNRVREFVLSLHRPKRLPLDSGNNTDDDNHDEPSRFEIEGPIIERITFARKMTELGSFLDRREEVLTKLEGAHIKLAKKVLKAVKSAKEKQEHGPSAFDRLVLHKKEKKGEQKGDLEGGEGDEAEERMDLLIRTIGPFVDAFEMGRPLVDVHMLTKLVTGKSSLESNKVQVGDQTHPHEINGKTIWDALFSLPRTTLDHFQPLIHLSHLFRGKTVPAIDYYTTKLGYLSSIIAEARSKQVTEYEALSTAFVTFTAPQNARKACKFLAVNPSNPYTCSVTMAPDYEDLDWVRLMKLAYKTEFLKDWVVDIGVWIFTIAWIIPVSLLVALVSIQNIASVIPALQRYLNKHAYAEEVISSFIPTILVALLMILVPLILLLIAKKAHTISTLSLLHDRIMTRYHKFLVANILVFFCVGVSALESLFTSIKTSLNILQIVKESFPTAGPFYVGWLIFTTAIHGGLELGLFGLPLIMYPSTKYQTIPRKRAVGIRPRTFNYYYWLPNHILVVTITLSFAVLNPLLIPFALIYFCVESVVVKNQLLHVYAKNYEGNGQVLLIRLARFSLDGLILAQVIFLALVAVLNKKVHIGFTAVMIAGTVFTKILLTRVCRANFESADISEAQIVTRGSGNIPQGQSEGNSTSGLDQHGQPSGHPVEGPWDIMAGNPRLVNFLTRKFNAGLNMSYSTTPVRKRNYSIRKPNPFTSRFSRFRSWDGVLSMGAPSATNANKGDQEKEKERIHQRLEVAKSLPDLLHEANAEKDENHSPPSTPPNHRGQHPLVEPHEKHPPWDDDSRVDQPYDNPYYVQPFHNYLWLPRNPVGKLDLDDTVNVHKSLTSEPGGGHLGEWMDDVEVISGLPSTFGQSEVSIPATMNTGGMSRQLSGFEEIVLPPAIARRVSNIDDEEDVEHTVEQTFYQRLRRPSTATRRALIIPSAEDQTLPMRPPPSARRHTFNTVDGLPMLNSPTHSGPSTRSQPGSSLHGRNRSHSVGIGPNSPDSTSPLRSRRSALSSQFSAPHTMVTPRYPVGSLSSHPLSSHPRESMAAVSAREALVGEVIAEETQAAVDRMKEESQRSGRFANRSWLTAWMYSSLHHAEDSGSKKSEVG